MRAHLRDVLHLEEVIDRFTVLGQTTTSIMQSSPVPGRPARPQLPTVSVPSMPACLWPSTGQ